jgi:hypothetical protein
VRRLQSSGKAIIRTTIVSFSLFKEYLFIIAGAFHLAPGSITISKNSNSIALGYTINKKLLTEKRRQSHCFYMESGKL